MQKIMPCLEISTANTSMNQTLSNKTMNALPESHSRWTFYWAHYNNWCFSVFTIGLIVDTSLVLRRYFIENKQFMNAKELETW